MTTDIHFETALHNVWTKFKKKENYKLWMLKKNTVIEEDYLIE